MASDTTGIPGLPDKKRGALWGTLSLSVLIHAGVVLLLGGVVVFSVMERPPAQFRPPPPPPVRIEPQKLEHKVRLKEQQQSSGRPQVQPRLAADRVADIALPKVDTEVTEMHRKLSKDMLKNFSSAGVGTGIGTGRGRGGLGSTASSVNFFGVRATGERIAILVDVSRSMVSDEKGGLTGYDTLKAEVQQIVDKLGDGTFFNLIFFDSYVDLFKSELLLARPSSKKEAGEFIQPYFGNFTPEFIAECMAKKRYPNASRLKNFQAPKLEALEKYASGSGTTRLDLALIAAFQMKADTIFVISDGQPLIARKMTEKEQQAFDKELAARSEELKARSEKHYRELTALNEKRARRGLPPKILEGGAGGLGAPKLTKEQILEYLRTFMIEMYGPEQKSAPRIHAVAYGADPNGEIFLRTLTKEYRGQFRKIRGLAPAIK